MPHLVQLDHDGAALGLGLLGVHFGEALDPGLHAGRRDPEQLGGAVHRQAAQVQQHRLDLDPQRHAARRRVGEVQPAGLAQVALLAAHEPVLDVLPAPAPLAPQRHPLTPSAAPPPTDMGNLCGAETLDNSRQIRSDDNHNAANGSRDSGTSLRSSARKPIIGAVLRELIVDFSGIILPGFGFTASLVPTILVPIAALIYAPNIVIMKLQGMKDVFSSFGRLVEILHLEVFTSIIAFLYVIGHVFFRLDPKIPDAKSYWRLPLDDKASGPIRTGVSKLRISSSSRDWPMVKRLPWWQSLPLSIFEDILESLSLNKA